MSSKCELSISTKDCGDTISPGEAGVVDVHEYVNFARKFWEHERASNAVSVKGSLAKNVGFWRDIIQGSLYILDIVQSGFVMPFHQEPTSCFCLTPASALANVDFVCQAIDELVADGHVIEAAMQPHVCSPLSVVVNSAGKKRLVVNLPHVNKFLCKQRFKYEDLRVAMLLLEKGDYMCTVQGTLSFGKTSGSLPRVDPHFWLRLPVSPEYSWSWDTTTIKTHVPT